MAEVTDPAVDADQAIKVCGLRADAPVRHYSGKVPLGWRNATADLDRLRRAITGIGFAAVLIFMQLGFLQAFLESALQFVRAFDGQLIVLSSTHYQIAQRESFQRRRLYQARSVSGVKSVSPILVELQQGRWKSPIDGKTHVLRVIGIDPNNPAVKIAGTTVDLAALNGANTAIADSRARRFLGTTVLNLQTELAGRRINVIGTFPMGPDFVNDGSLIMGERNFLKFFEDPAVPGHRRREIEYGIIKLEPGADSDFVARRLSQKLPDDVVVLTKAQMIEQEVAFQLDLSPVGPIFGLGTIIGFVVGILITYQILFTEISHQQKQFATLKAIGYSPNYLVGAIVHQSVLYGVAGFIPALALSAILFLIIGEWLLLPMKVSVFTVVTTLCLLFAMCTIAGLIAARKVLTADPAELF